jgi:hypothetical protein
LAGVVDLDWLKLPTVLLKKMQRAKARVKVVAETWHIVRISV